MRAGGDRRGNNESRRRRRRWLLETFDQDLGDGVARCHLQLAGDRCHIFVDERTLTVDRIDPGGTYRRENIQPACQPCQTDQGALITRERRWEWRSMMAEAEARGIEWDGVLPQRGPAAAAS